MGRCSSKVLKFSGEASIPLQPNEVVVMCLPRPGTRVALRAASVHALQALISPTLGVFILVDAPETNRRTLPPLVLHVQGEEGDA